MRTLAFELIAIGNLRPVYLANGNRAAKKMTSAEQDIPELSCADGCSFAQIEGNFKDIFSDFFIFNKAGFAIYYTL